MKDTQSVGDLAPESILSTAMLLNEKDRDDWTLITSGWFWIWKGDYILLYPSSHDLILLTFFTLHDPYTHTPTTTTSAASVFTLFWMKSYQLWVCKGWKVLRDYSNYEVLMKCRTAWTIQWDGTQTDAAWKGQRKNIAFLSTTYL